MKFKKALKLLKQGELVKTPSNTVVKLDREWGYLATYDGSYFSRNVDLDDILSDDWQLPSEYELQLLACDKPSRHEPEPEFKPEIYVPKTKLTGIEFIRDIRNKQYIVNFNAGRYPNAHAFHTYNLLFSQIKKLNSADELAKLFTQVILDYDDCIICPALLESETDHFWRGDV